MIPCHLFSFPLSPGSVEVGSGAGVGVGSGGGGSVFDGGSVLVRVTGGSVGDGGKLEIVKQPCSETVSILPLARATSH